MTFSELQELFVSLTNTDEVDSSTLCIWFNEAQLDLALDFGEVKELPLRNAALFDMPDDLLKVLTITESGDHADWGISPAGKLVLPSSGNYELVYRAMPSIQFSPVDVDAESALPAPIHYLMAYYAAWKFWDMESEGDTEESNHATKFLNYYRQGKATMLSKLDFDGAGGSIVDRWRII